MFLPLHLLVYHNKCFFEAALSVSVMPTKIVHTKLTIYMTVIHCTNVAQITEFINSL